jgi:hypothetical protein
MRALLFILLCLQVFDVKAQDLTGIWRGHFRSGGSSKLMDSLQIEDRYKFETQINQTDKAFEGVTYSYKSTVFYGKASCYGAINTKTKKVLLEENRLLEVKSLGGACLMTLFLQYSKVGNEEFLEGTFSAMSVADSLACPGGTVFLRKVPTTDFYKEPFLVEREKEKEKQKKIEPPIAKTTPAPKKNTPPVVKKTPAPAKKPANVPKSNIASAPKKRLTTPPKPPASKSTAKTTPKVNKTTRDPLRKNEVLKQLTTEDSFKKISPRANVGTAVPRVLETRVNELVKTIITPAKNVSIKIYDNGTIDNDTVSVYVDNKLVISRQRLTDKAIVVNISLDEKVPFHEMVMVAENLGEIPPNTSLMIVNAGDKQYEVRITSTEQKNAVVHFKKE